ncbi:MAG: hypothetical protein ACD_4C00173G0002 [uncultured bacterium (gcode 4)]|uniref:Uncharacterized protein n=1 Tax=uncultured bacterium (gcode 4) TaxID=1234023 RepID=K2GTR2_9BACT|nr:MAG: hypothetical protein ACD_4C00173G0002 [uncultured bacterium (gcode 4)]
MHSLLTKYKLIIRLISIGLIFCLIQNSFVWADGGNTYNKVNSYNLSPRSINVTNNDTVKTPEFIIKLIKNHLNSLKKKEIEAEQSIKTNKLKEVEDKYRFNNLLKEEINSFNKNGSVLKRASVTITTIFIINLLYFQIIPVLFTDPIIPKKIIISLGILSLVAINFFFEKIFSFMKLKIYMAFSNSINENKSNEINLINANYDKQVSLIEQKYKLNLEKLLKDYLYIYNVLNSFDSNKFVNEEVASLINNINNDKSDILNEIRILEQQLPKLQSELQLAQLNIQQYSRQRIIKEKVQEFVNDSPEPTAPQYNFAGLDSSTIFYLMSMEEDKIKEYEENMEQWRNSGYFVTVAPEILHPDYEKLLSSEKSIQNEIDKIRSLKKQIHDIDIKINLLSTLPQILSNKSTLNNDHIKYLINQYLNGKDSEKKYYWLLVLMKILTALDSKQQIQLLEKINFLPNTFPSNFRILQSAA